MARGELRSALAGLALAALCACTTSQQVKAPDAPTVESQGVAPSAAIFESDASERDMAETVCPFATRSRAAAPPTKPDAPVMKMCIRTSLSSQFRHAELVSASIARQVRSLPVKWTLKQVQGDENC